MDSGIIGREIVGSGQWHLRRVPKKSEVKLFLKLYFVVK